jgi:hypothetical protein
VHWNLATLQKLSWGSELLVLLLQGGLVLHGGSSMHMHVSLGAVLLLLRWQH